MANSSDEMVRGYMRGFEGEDATMPACYAKESAAFKHGWKNGRDDRTGTPRDRAEVLRRRAAIIEASALEG